MSDRLEPDECRSLLRLARATLRQDLIGDGALHRELERTKLTAALREARGAFVTLKRSAPPEPESLRGCIGCIAAREPLHRSVIGLARKAAFEDPRFAPLRAEELGAVRIEISALTPLRGIADPAEIVVGRHGVQLEQGPSRAVFLPQVAPEHGWDLPTLLRQLARKAGLPEDAWREARLGVFEAQVFGEPGLAPCRLP